MFQLNLPCLNSKDTLQASLERMTGKPVSVAITDNTASLLSIRQKDSLISVRMHWMFLNAGDEIIREVALFLAKRKGPTPLIRKFIRENRNCIKERDCSAKAPAATRTEGRFYDLRELFDTLNATYFDGRVSSTISWGRRGTRRVVRRRILGSFNSQTNMIRISTVLDRRNIPRFFIRYIIYHEMLHSIMKEENKNGRRLIHSPEFRHRERLFREYQEAIVWEKKHFTGDSREDCGKT